MSEPHKEYIKVNYEYEKVGVSIVADGAIANPEVAEGRMIPLIILDTTERLDLEEYIRVHRFVEEGDVKSVWSQPLDRKNIINLILWFLRPSDPIAILEFDLSRNHGVLIEHILATRLLYIQAGRPGDRLKHNLNLPKVILEIPENDNFQGSWNKIHFHYIVAQFREKGLSRPKAKRAAKDFLKELHGRLHGYQGT